MNIARIMSLAAAGTLVAGCAAANRTDAAGRHSGGQCFHADRVNSFLPAGPYAVNVRVGVNDYYRLELAGNCRDFNWTRQVVLRARTSSWVCRPYDADLIASDPATGVNSCPISSVRKLSEAEVEFLKNR